MMDAATTATGGGSAVPPRLEGSNTEANWLARAVNVNMSLAGEQGLAENIYGGVTFEGIRSSVLSSFVIFDYSTFVG